MKLKSMQQQRTLRPKLFTVKVSEIELEIIREKAKLYTENNLSEWIRYSSTQLLPKSRDLLDENDSDTLRGQDDSTAPEA